MQPIILKNFIETDDVEQLNSWTIANYSKEFFKDANMGVPGSRLTTRYSFDFSFPDIAYTVKEKIKDRLGVETLPPHFKDGIVNGIGFNSGSIYEHTDPVWYPDTFTLHCNFITQKSIHGGVTYIEDIPYETNPRDLLIYPVSQLKHSVSEITGNVPRILWVFGFSIKNETKIY